MSKDSRNNLKNRMRQLLPYFLWACAVIVFAVLFYQYTKNSSFPGIAALRTVLKPIIIGLVITFFMAPACARVEEWLFQLQHWMKTTPRKIPVTKKYRASENKHAGFIRFLSMLLCYVLIIGLLIMAIVYVIPQLINSLSTIISLVADSVTKLVAKVNQLADKYENLPMADYIKADDLTTFVNTQLGSLTTTVQDAIKGLVPQIYNMLVSFANSLLNLIIGIIVSIYLVADRERMLQGVKKIVYALFDRERAMVLLNIGSETADIFKFFFLGKLIDSLIIGILCYILMHILGLDYALLIASIVGVTNIIPYFGPWIGAIPSALILLMSSPMQALIFVIMILVLQQFDGNILGPYILGGTLGIKPFWIIFSVTVGGGLFGIPGMLFGVPVFTAIYTIFKRFINHRFRRQGEEDLDQLEKDRHAFSHPIVSAPAPSAEPRQGLISRLRDRFPKKKK